MRIRTLMSIVALTLAGAPQAFAQGATVPKLAEAKWKPERPIEFVVQASAGGGSDIFARNIAKVLASEKIVTVPINVVNKDVKGRNRAGL